MTSALNLHAVAQFSAERMVSCLVEGSAIALFAWLLLRVIGARNSGRKNSGTRFAVWFVALMAIAALPFAGALVRSGAAGSAGAAHPAMTMPSAWATYLFTIWAAIAVLGLFRVGIGLWQVHRVRRNCVTIETASLDPALQATLKEFGSVRRVTVCVSDSLQVPTAIGFIEPVVALPAWTMRELSPAELNTILLHELAHLRRWDDWTNLAQKLLRAVFFFHPAVWWIESKLSLEREMACDDAVLASTANARAYAQCLVAVAEKSFVRRGLAMAQAAVSRVRQTSQRVAQILDVNRAGATRVWTPAIAMVAAFAMVCAGLSARGPELVSFQDKATGTESASAMVTGLPPSAPLKLMADAVHPANIMAARHSNRAIAKSTLGTVLAKASISRHETGMTEPGEATPDSSQLKPQVIPASYSPSKEMGANEASPQETNPRLQSVVLVYQGLRVDDEGFAHWTICVWRVTVPSHQTTITNPAKST